MLVKIKCCKCHKDIEFDEDQVLVVDPYGINHLNDDFQCKKCYKKNIKNKSKAT